MVPRIVTAASGDGLAASGSERKDGPIIADNRHKAPISAIGTAHAASAAGEREMHNIKIWLAALLWAAATLLPTVAALEAAACADASALSSVQL
jgi:hypothetical protein